MQYSVLNLTWSLLENLSHCRLFFADILLHLYQVCFSHEVLSQVFFADTIPHAPAPGLLHELLQDGHPALNEVRKFGLEALHQHLFPERAYPGE